jgi:hypothetical protein
MISLIKILNEIISKPKAIIMAGGSSVGKSTVLKSIGDLLKNFKDINADKYVEDVNSPLYGNLAAAASKIKKEDLPLTIEAKHNLIYDTTAANLNTLTPILHKLKEKNYDVMMIMVYAHPIVSFLRNFKRERKVPTVGILNTWINVYSLIDDYKKIFNDNFIIINNPAITPEEKREIENFQKAYESGKLKEYFDKLISTGEYTSTFKKDDTNLSPEELEKKEKQREATKKILSSAIEKIANDYENIQSKLNPLDIKELPNKIREFIR